MLILTRVLTAAVSLALLPAGSALAAAPPPPGCQGIQATDKAGDSANALTQEPGSKSSDLTAGWIAYEPGSDKATANIQVVELTPGQVDPPYVAISWTFSFTTSEGPRFVRAYQDRTGTVRYSWGEPRAVTDDQTTPRKGGATTGSLFPGKDGVVSIEMPLKDLGAPAGSELKAMALEVRQWGSLPAAVPNTGLPLVYPAPIYDEAAGRGTFRLGPCPAGAPGGGGTPGGGGGGSGAPGTPGTSAPGSPTSPQRSGTLGIKVTVPRLSARKLAKRKKFVVKLTGNATKLVAQLRAGPGPDAKVLGSGKLSVLKKRGKLTLKFRRKLKKGKYVLLVGGRNAQGQPAEGGVSIKVRR